MTFLSSRPDSPRRFYAVIIAAVLVLTAAPYVFGMLVTPRGAVFDGSHTLTPGDFSVYFSYLEQVREHTGLVRDLYTTEANVWPFFTPFWTTAGIVGAMLHLPPGYTLHLVRLLLIVPFLVLVAVFVETIFRSPTMRRWAFVFITFSSGSGVLVLPFLKPFLNAPPGYYHFPVDLWVPEAITFLTLYHNPLFIAALTGLVAALTFLLRAFDTPRDRHAVLWAGAGAFVAILLHPFHAYTLLATVGVYLLLRLAVRHHLDGRQLRILVQVGLLALPAVLYHAAVLRFDPGAAGRAAQNINLMTTWGLTVGSYGVLGLLALVGVVIVLRRQFSDHRRLFLVSWFGAHAFLVYAPLQFQRRLTEGWHIPMALLALIAIAAIGRTVVSRLPRTLRDGLTNPILHVLAFSFIFALSNANVIAVDLQDYARATPENIPLFHYDRQDEVVAYAWIRDHTRSDAIVFATPTTSLFLPGQTARRVYAGHSVETLDWATKGPIADHLFSPIATEAEWRAFLQREGVDLLWWGPREWEHAAFDPGRAAFLTPVFQNDRVTLYAVR